MFVCVCVCVLGGREETVQMDGQGYLWRRVAGGNRTETCLRPVTRLWDCKSPQVEEADRSLEVGWKGRHFEV